MSHGPSMANVCFPDEVATCSVMKPVSVPEGSAAFTGRVRPKPQTFKSQLTLRRKFEGLRSWWIMSVECNASSTSRVANPSSQTNTTDTHSKAP